jgi:hypothetical protein
MPPMPTPIGAIPAEILQDFLTWWARRSHRSAARNTASLTFWRDGMVKHLKAISRGEATKSTFVELERQFKATRKGVQEALVRLVRVRRKLAAAGAHALADQVDIILNEKQLGKDSVRRNIEYILEHRDDEDVRYRALEVCNQIDALNAAIRRLQRLASQ